MLPLWIDSCTNLCAQQFIVFILFKCVYVLVKGKRIQCLYFSLHLVAAEVQSVVGLLHHLVGDLHAECEQEHELAQRWVHNLPHQFKLFDKGVGIGGTRALVHVVFVEGSPPPAIVTGPGTA